MDTNELKNISTAALAYLGDCVMELCVREYLVEQGLSSSARLNSAALDFVRAPKQAEAMKNIAPMLTEQEESVYKRGRNMSHSAMPKAATMAEYRAATGMEALFGWLHLQGREDRIKELFLAAYFPKETKEEN